MRGHNIWFNETVQMRGHNIWFNETVQMRGHNIWFYAELAKISLVITKYSLLSRALIGTKVNVYEVSKLPSVP